MPSELQTKPSKAAAPRRKNIETEEPSQPTSIGWQGIRFTLPPDWNLTGFSMDRENGYLRVDAPGESTLTVQVRWLNASNPDQNSTVTAYSIIAPFVRHWLKRPAPVAPTSKLNLSGNLERILKETEKQAKKAKATFESAIKPERIEGKDGERSAIYFSWTGEGRAQGKIWHCKTCDRVVVAQVVGMAKDQSAIANIASRLFATFQDHAVDGYDRWALYDLQLDVPSDFRLQEQKLLSGHLHLEWARGGERIVLDRWGLANMLLKKFSLGDWFRNNALVPVKALTRDDAHTVHGHESLRYLGGLPLMSKLQALRDSRVSLKRFPTRYEGGIWNCADSNKIYALQVLHQKQTVGLWEDIVSRCVCHRPDRLENIPVSQQDKQGIADIEDELTV